ncbi:MAG: CRISPR-associated helicase Cas3' [Treponema sp.]|jgi:CRISPR-associated endonuclease/helicase Cas3|nr:CRISPR-associated helicase Cas3' [Treponema sp.]
MIRVRNSTPKTEEPALPLEKCLAKTREDSSGKRSLPGIDVQGHCIIVGETARALIGHSIPGIRDRFFPPGSELVAAVHDVGKICPAFQEKLHRVIGYRPNSCLGLRTAEADPEKEKRWRGHAAVSQAALEECPEYIPGIAGRHHGWPTNIHSATSEYFGGAPWQRRREELIGNLKTWFAVPWPEIKSDIHAAVLSGLTCVSDWIGSGPAFDEIERIENTGELPQRVKAALEAAGFVSPLVRQGLSFKDVFKFDPYPVQSQFIEAVSSPGVYVLEAPMGMGKTEAALYAAYKILAGEKASGIYFALPTRFTSDKIHERMKSFLDRILDEASPRHQVHLLHSSAWLSLAEMGEEGGPGGSWFNVKKRGILAPFAAGTVDQALMAVMNVKHNFVRTFGLAGKVVILDEVHSYDSYTGTILDELVKGLRELGCTVIILSATLTAERRQKLLGITEDGVNSVSVNAGLSYPLISALGERGKTPREIPVKVPETISVTIRRADDNAAVEEALRRAEEGQQVLWIENMVNEAQAKYRKLSARATECGVEVGLLHSRFVQADRKINEDKWVDLYGTKGKTRRAEKGRILVGTQVLEQSLDIDADFLVTRLCPTDMLLQRTGRLWRHPDTPRPDGACCEAWILTADYGQVLENYRQELSKSAPVYDPYVLLRTLEVWENQGTLKLPGDIRRLLEETYKERDEEGIPGKLKHELEKERSHLGNLALSATASTDKTTGDSRAKTRYSEQETADVLLLRSAEKNGDGGISLVLSNGDPLELPGGLKKNDKEWRKRAAILNRHIVTVPEKYAPLPPQARFLDWFKDYVYTGNIEEKDVLRIALLNESGDLEGKNGYNIIGGYDLSYDHKYGYTAVKKNTHD